MKERRTALYDRSSFNRDIMEIYKVMKYRIYFFLIVFVFMIGGLWASPVKVIVRQPVLVKGNGGICVSFLCIRIYGPGSAGIFL